MTVNHGVLGSSPCSGADARGLRKVLSFPAKCRVRDYTNAVQDRRGRLCSPEPFLWELSSAGSERLPYKQRVGGSNPSAPTRLQPSRKMVFLCREHSSVGLERLLDKQEVSGSNPLVPTTRGREGGKTRSARRDRIETACSSMQAVFRL